MQYQQEKVLTFPALTSRAQWQRCAGNTSVATQYSALRGERGGVQCSANRRRSSFSYGMAIYNIIYIYHIIYAGSLRAQLRIKQPAVC